ncbi:MAG: CoA-disulfide reductase [Aeromicrobium sp.]|jgi:NADH oxidase (H2O2-forming)|uniref:FAD-dependent oxidoreductase n=1 Tax=Aeromicrobium sp. TaxID=1871063 RepID=UPI00260C40FB|nr:FAD-dependent oxidoreductase [Aeromicrobium sp.]MCW2788684.1 CoA-disulfide reductase [Aeromicrobium sp.]MCW2825638.1 CoA-disulfide reductase [Aeromicrobium sp.]
MANRIIVVGGGAAGFGAAGAALGSDPGAKVTVYTSFEDAAYSPCGIPYVHGKEIPAFEDLFLATKQHYVDQGMDVRYETTVASIDVNAKTVTLEDGTVDRYDKLILATGFNYADPGVPGTDLSGLYYVKNIRQAMEWDKVLDTVKSAVVCESTPLGLEMVTALAHRGIKTHLVDPAPWAMSMATDPDIIKPVEDSWIEMGAELHFNTTLKGFVGDGKLRAVATSAGEIEADLAVVATEKTANTALASAAGIKLGMSGGIIVDSHLRTSAPDVFAAGDCIEAVHGVSKVPIQGLSGAHAYAQGKAAGTNAGGGDREYRAVYVPWGMVAGKWMIGGVSFSETLATALGMDFVVGNGQGISRARYYPGVKPVKVKLLAEPKDLRLIGAQMVGGEGIKERADFLAMAVRKGITLHDLASMENVYSPPIGALAEPIATAAQDGLNNAGA